MYKTLIISTAAIAALAVSALAFAPRPVSEPKSGLDIGELVSAFNPTHVTGPLAGTDSCPPCTYGNLPMVQAWVNGDSKENITAVAKTLDQQMEAKSGAELKTFVIVLTSDPKSTAAELKEIGETNHLKYVALAYLDKKSPSVDDYKVAVNSEVKNTVFVYKKRRVESKFVNLNPDEKGLSELTAAIAKITD
jgi:hypothetical protein